MIYNKFNIGDELVSLSSRGYKKSFSREPLCKSFIVGNITWNGEIVSYEDKETKIILNERELRENFKIVNK